MKDLILRLTDKGVASMTGNNNHIFLKELKEREKMSYAELSELTGIPKDTLANWILGRREPPNYVIKLLKEKLTVSKGDTL